VSRKLVVNSFITLDGVMMQAPGGPEEDPTGGKGVRRAGPPSADRHHRAADGYPTVAG
jgi:hypothetical protein